MHSAQNRCHFKTIDNFVSGRFDWRQLGEAGGHGDFPITVPEGGQRLRSPLSDLSIACGMGVPGVQSFILANRGATIASADWWVFGVAADIARRRPVGNG